MSVTSDIAQSYRAPRQVMRRLLDRGRREDQALLFLLFACVLLFIAQAPAQARLAHLDPEIPRQARLYWSALFLIFLLPFVFYACAFALWFLMRLAGAAISAYQARLSLFWALLAASPVALLAGLTAAFVGPGGALQLVVFLWVAIVLLFTVQGLREARSGQGA